MKTDKPTAGKGRLRSMLLITGLVTVFTLLLCAANINPYVQLIRSRILQMQTIQRNNSPTNPRVMCMIMTRISNWETKGKAVRNTWAKRCHSAIFFYTNVGNWTYSSIAKEPNATGLDVPDGRDHLTAKTFAALNYSYFNYESEVDFFLKADDDTYVIMENLQRIISKFNSSPLLYLGRRIDNLLPRGYNSGGAGYVIGKEAAKLMMEGRSSFPQNCPKDGAIEDRDIGRCLSNFGIYPVNELDESGRLVFHSDNPLRVLQGNKVANAYYIDFGGAEFGNYKTRNSGGFMLSEWTATMHYVSPPEMYMYDFLLYGLRRESTGSDRS